MKDELILYLSKHLDQKQLEELIDQLVNAYIVLYGIGELDDSALKNSEPIDIKTYLEKFRLEKKNGKY